MEAKTVGQEALFVVKDGPQFILKVVNSMLIGQSWSWFYVITKLLSLKGIAYKFIHDAGNDKHIQFHGKLTICANVCFILPILVFVMYMIEYNDQRPEWARPFPTFRCGFGELEYPDINTCGR